MLRAWPICNMRIKNPASSRADWEKGGDLTSDRYQITGLGASTTIDNMSNLTYYQA